MPVDHKILAGISDHFDASAPVIEETLVKLFELRGIDRARLDLA